jgi:hypothetical protein
LSDEEDYHFHSRIKVDGRLVDEAMADLMKAVWSFGLRTIDCCQGDPEKPFPWAWIQFWDLPDGIKFLEGTAYLGNWRYGNDVCMYLTEPVVVQAPPSPMILISPYLLPEVTKRWIEGTAKVPDPDSKMGEAFL